MGEDRWSVMLRVFDSDRCKWDCVDVWGGVAGDAGASLLEAYGAFEHYAENLVKRQGCQLTLPFD